MFFPFSEEEFYNFFACPAEVIFDLQGIIKILSNLLVRRCWINRKEESP